MLALIYQHHGSVMGYIYIFVSIIFTSNLVMLYILYMEHLGQGQAGGFPMAPGQAGSMRHLNSSGHTMMAAAEDVNVPNFARKNTWLVN